MFSFKTGIIDAIVLAGTAGLDGTGVDVTGTVTLGADDGVSGVADGTGVVTGGDVGGVGGLWDDIYKIYYIINF